MIVKQDTNLRSIFESVFLRFNSKECDRDYRTYISFTDAASELVRIAKDSRNADRSPDDSTNGFYTALMVHTAVASRFNREASNPNRQTNAPRGIATMLRGSGISLTETDLKRRP